MSNSINTGTDINGLSANTTYTYYLYPINSNGQSASYTQLQFTTLPTITSASLVSIDSSNQITLKWSGSYNTVKVYYSTNNTDYTQYGTSYNSATTSVSISPLSTNQFYYFKVEPYNTGLVTGTTTYITELSAVTMGFISTLTYGFIDTSSVTLSWTGTYNTVDISYSSSLYTKSFSINNSTTLTTQITNLSSDTSYLFRVYPYNSYNLRGIPSSLTVSTYGALTYDTYLDTTKMNFAFSMRLTVKSYSGPVVNIRNSSNNATEDFYANTSQTYLRTSTGTSYADWIGTSTGYVTKWYDQSGLGNHATNLTAGTTQPTLALQNGKYVIQFNTTNVTKLTLTTSSKPNTVFCHFYNSNSQYGAIISSDIDYTVRFGNPATTTLGDNNTDDWYSSSSSSSGNTKLSYVNNVSTNTVGISSWNVLTLSTTSPTWRNSSSFTTIGKYNTATERSLTGYMVEMICHNTTMAETSAQVFYKNRLF